MIDDQQPENEDVLGDVFASERDRRAESDQSEISDSGRPRDELGRFAPVNEAAVEPEAQAPPTEGQVQEAEELHEPEQVEEGHSVPLATVLAERKAFQARLEEQQRLMQVEVQRQVAAALQQQNPQAQPEPPDFFEDPDAAIAARMTPMQQQMVSMKLDFSEMMARQAHGNEVVEEALQAAQQAGIVQNFIQTQNPYGELVSWHKQSKFLKEAGNDPDAYRKRVEEEVRQKVIQEMKQGRAPGQQQQPSFPTTLADQTNAGQGNNGAHLSDEAMMAGLFNPDRSARG